MINLLCALCALWNVFYLCVPLFNCLHIEDTVKIELHKIGNGDFLKICCADFCSFQKYNVTTKTYLFIKENIILHNCKNGIKLYHSSDYFFHLAHFVKNDQMIEIVDSFEHEKIKFTVWEPLFEFLSIGGNQKYVYMPLGFYEAKKCKRNHTKGNVIGVDALCDNYGSIEFRLNRGETEPFYEDPAICDLCAKRMTIVGEPKRGGKKRYKKWSLPSYKSMLKIASLLLLLAILMATIWIFLKRKKCKMKDEKNPRCAEKRLAEIHVAYKNKIQTNFGSKIKDITDEDLINLIAHNKAELIIVCQP
ncbi:hypothetical protein PCYB_081870 [Plasmodium cynomolgi strain B]|uniref:Uncharacterized protein n=1 Tax=Plasmodium cynomolgi (strain B) TaxID=1120755 RepID=K6UD58_PLACD|nr:hypothetical protein PCYB_081870 [Plasmodium cynomolgi strain B]GAB66026.1 hypothetical protein PCYB_081870 [Plasmodium cynomolgi strain B]